MPYAVGGSNLPSNVKKMDKKAQAQWVAVFNSALKDGKSEGDAFKLANGVDNKDYYDDLYEASYKKLSQSDAGYDAVGMKDSMACASCHWFISPESCALVQGDISPTGLSKFYMKAVPQTPYSMPVTIVEPDDGDSEDAYTMPMMGKSAEGNIVSAVLNGVKSLLRPVISVKAEAVPLTFVSVKDVDGNTRLRFMAVVSNNFKDRESEIIPEAAHQEYVDWATKEGSYPELWLWHAGPATRWGQADWLDVSDGFLVASGLVDKGMEYIALNIEADAKAGNPVGVSHGFLCMKSNGTIGPYRSFELSPLPLKAAANEWTAFTTLNGESMAFTQQRREWLKKNGGISDEAISALEQATSSVAKSLKERGIEYKDLGIAALEDEPKVAAPSEKKPLSPLDAAIASITGIKAVETAKAVTNAHKTKPTEYKDVPDDMFLDPENFKYPIDESHIKAAHSYFNQSGQREAGGYSDAQWATMGGKLAKALGSDYEYKNGVVVQKTKDMKDDDTQLSSKEFTDLAARIDATNATVVEMSTAVKGLTELFQSAIEKLSKSDDQKTAEFFKARTDSLPRGFQASADSGNTNDPLVAQVAKQIADVQKNGWFTETVMKGLEVNQ